MELLVFNKFRGVGFSCSVSSFRSRNGIRIGGFCDNQRSSRRDSYSKSRFSQKLVRSQYQKLVRNQGLLGPCAWGSARLFLLHRSVWSDRPHPPSQDTASQPLDGCADFEAHLQSRTRTTSWTTINVLPSCFSTFALAMNLLPFLTSSLGP
jgi:hypothetical protein